MLHEGDVRGIVKIQLALTDTFEPVTAGGKGNDVDLEILGREIAALVASHAESLITAG
jgi:hypothetical protein